MTTTVMKDSRVGDQWIYQACQQAPVQRVLDDKTGLPNGNILTGPVRLAFCDSLFTAKPAMANDPTSKLKHSTVILFTPWTDLTIFWEEFNRIAAADFSKHFNGQQYVGLDIPIYNAGMKSNYSGFTPGLMAMNTSSDFKPAIVDARMNPITDESKVYAGVWAIVAVSAYASGKNYPRKGPRFGLQSIMIIGDDTPLAGSAPDPRTLYKGINVVPPTIAPGAAFGQSVQTPALAGPLTGVGAVGQFYPPGVGQAAPPPPPGQYAPYRDPNDVTQFM